MKFTSAWANVLSQNVTLRLVVLLLAFCSLFFCISTIRLAVRDPLVVERACYSKVLQPVDPKHTDREVEAFLREAVPARFNSETTKALFLLSDEELAFRKREQDDLYKKEMRQKVIVNSVKMDGPRFTLDTDRMISIGKIRSALPFPLNIELSSTTRTEGNPYGLILKRVSQPNDEGSKNEKK